MQADTYAEYLETLVLSLLAERGHERDIAAKETTNSSYVDSTFSVYLVRDSIIQERQKRDGNKCSIACPTGAFKVKPNRALRLNHHHRHIEVWDNLAPDKWQERWVRVANITHQCDEAKWYNQEDLDADDAWVNVAYFWKDIEDDDE